jgi:hypothetical protein
VTLGWPWRPSTSQVVPMAQSSLLKQVAAHMPPLMPVDASALMQKVPA